MACLAQLYLLPSKCVEWFDQMVEMIGVLLLSFLAPLQVNQRLTSYYYILLKGHSQDECWLQFEWMQQQLNVCLFYNM